MTLRPGEVIGFGALLTCTFVEHLSLTVRESFPGWLHDCDFVIFQVQGLVWIRQTLRVSASCHIR
nr:hypothetical protein [Mycobacterium leprae]